MTMRHYIVRSTHGVSKCACWIRAAFPVWYHEQFGVSARLCGRHVLPLKAELVTDDSRALTCVSTCNPRCLIGARHTAQDFITRMLES
jgi:hypothetical protein